MSEDGWDHKKFKPRNIAVAGRELAIAWADGHESYYLFDEFRKNCPCATCRAEAEKAAADPLRVVKGPAAGQISIAGLAPVGAYAVQIRWSDGHNTGIYTFEPLRRGCECGECRSRPGAGGR